MKKDSNTPFFFLCLLLLPFLLGGCVLAPGSNIDVRGFFEDENGGFFGSESEEPVLEDMIDIFNISPDLLSSLQLQESTRAQNKGEISSSNILLDIDEYDYYIGKGDVLSIIVYEHPELTIPAGAERSAEESGNVVHSDGTIFYPYIGMVEVLGYTFKEVRDEIQSRLAEFITDPQVDVKVISYRSQKAYVTGQVNNPGTLVISDVPLTVLDAISQVGGLQVSANWHEVILTRDDEDIELSVFEMLNNGHLEENFLLRHGDVLHVPDLGNHKVFMMGEVGTVSSLEMGNLSMSLTDAIAQAGGINQLAARASGVFVIRQTSLNSQKLATIYQLDVSNAIAFALGAQFMLEPTDIVYVTTAPITRWNRVISQLLPSITALYNINRLDTF